MTIKLKDEISKSERLINWLGKKIGGLEINNSDRYLLAAGCLDIALEHHKSIVLLTANKLYGSAAALVRLVFESYIRGVWLLYCANDIELNKYKNEKMDKRFYQLIDDIEKHEAFSGGTLSRVKKKSWKIMNSVTHCGFHHVVRRFNGSEIAPDYTDEEILDGIDTANSVSILTGVAIADMVGNEELLKEISDKGMEYFNVRA